MNPYKKFGSEPRKGPMIALLLASRIFVALSFPRKLDPSAKDKHRTNNEADGPGIACLTGTVDSR